MRTQELEAAATVLHKRMKSHLSKNDALSWVVTLANGLMSNGLSCIYMLRGIV